MDPLYPMLPDTPSVSHWREGERDREREKERERIRCIKRMKSTILSHLPVENAATQHTKAMVYIIHNILFPFHQVPTTAGWAETMWGEIEVCPQLLSPSPTADQNSHDHVNSVLTQRTYCSVKS